MKKWPKIYENPKLCRLTCVDHWSASNVTLLDALGRRATLTVEGRLVAENQDYYLVQTGTAEFDDDTPETREIDVTAYFKKGVLSLEDVKEPRRRRK